MNELIYMLLADLLCRFNCVFFSAYLREKKIAQRYFRQLVKSF